MRIVRWTSQERVDQPDLTAMSFLVLGEFRRFTRSVLLGDEAYNAIISGYKVEQAAVPDTTVVVKLDTGADPSVAFGAENQGAIIKHGQVMGGKDDADRFEGNSQQTLDFTGQPAQTYTVEMRFEFADGANDNRAFWNPSSNEEFIAATDTRHLPQFALRFSGTPSAEWIPLATVDWDGVGPITTANIGDIREFAFEGAAPFDGATQAAAGMFVDFDRSADRATAGVNAIYPVMRALGRQIADLKGQSDNGVFNWYERVYGPHDPAIALPTQQTKTLRTIDTVTYTVGDGVTTFGDFNGTALGTGLDACLAHIETSVDSMPAHVRVLVKTNKHAIDDPVFLIANRVIRKTNTPGVDVTPIGLEIIGLGGTHGNDTTGQFERRSGRIAIECTGALSTNCIELGWGQHRFENLEIITQNDATAIKLASNGLGSGDPSPRCDLTMHNCKVAGDTSTGATGFAINTNTICSIKAENCTFVGRLQIRTGHNVFAERTHSSRFVRCRFNQPHVALSPDSSTQGARQVLFDQCAFIMDLTMNPVSIYTDPLHKCMLDLAGDVEEVEVRRCYFYNDVPNMDMIRLGHKTSGTSRSEHITIDGCDFRQHADQTSFGLFGGTNGSEGTGWMIYSPDTTSTSSKVEHLHVTNCFFTTSGPGVMDSGCMSLHEVKYARIHNNRIFDQMRPASGGRMYGIRLAGNFASAHRSYNVIAHNTFGEMATPINSGTLWCVFIEEHVGVKVIGNHFSGRTTSGTIITGLTFTGSALKLEEAPFTHVEGNHFDGWENSVTNTRCVGAEFSNAGLIFANNHFKECGAFPIDMSIADDCPRSVYMGNVFETGITPTFGGGIRLSPNLCSNVVIMGNTFSFGGVADAIDIQASDNIVLIGNNAVNGDIEKEVGSTGNVGYDDTTTGAPAGLEKNIVNAYT